MDREDENSRRLSLVDAGVSFAEAASDDKALPDVFLFSPNNDGSTGLFRSSLSNRPIAPMRGLCVVLEPFFEIRLGGEKLTETVSMFLSVKNSLRTQPSARVFGLIFGRRLSQGSRREIEDAEGTKEAIPIATLVKFFQLF